MQLIFSTWFLIKKGGDGLRSEIRTARLSQPYFDAQPLMK